MSDGLLIQDAQFLATLVHMSPSSGPKMSRHDVTKGIDASPKLLTANPVRRRLRPFGLPCFFIQFKKSGRPNKASVLTGSPAFMQEAVNTWLNMFFGDQ